jgi:hypothetical protein
VHYERDARRVNASSRNAREELRPSRLVSSAPRSVIDALPCNNIIRSLMFLAVPRAICFCSSTSPWYLADTGTAIATTIVANCPRFSSVVYLRSSFLLFNFHSLVSLLTIGGGHVFTNGTIHGDSDDRPGSSGAYGAATRRGGRGPYELR